MRKQLLSTIVACGACLAWGAQAQTATDPSSGSPSSYPSTTPGASSSSSASQSGWSSQRLSATGRMGHEAVRGSQLTGAQVTGSSGSQLGTISDTIINPASGRLEFAVISLSGGAAASSTGTSSTTPGATPGSTSVTSGATPGAGKQVAVPWMLLRTSSTAGASSTSATQQPAFVFTGDASKLESAPSFDSTTDLTQPTWRQSVFSYFGMSGRGFGGTGGAESPGGTSTGSQTPESPTGK